MGDIKRISCKCGYELDLFTGTGLNGINLRIIDQLYPKEAKIIKKRLDEGADVSYYMDNAISLCPECRSIKTISRLNYRIGNDEERSVYDKKCGDCKSDIALIPEEEVFCPKCGQKPKLQIVGHWD